MEHNLDDLIICDHCGSLNKRVVLKKGQVAKCSECGSVLYRNVEESFNKALAYSVTALILFIVANLFPIIKVSILGLENNLTIPQMILTLFNEGFIVVGAILIVVLVIAPLVVMLSFLALAFLVKTKKLKRTARHIISFLVISRDWGMVDIFAVSILVALVKLFGYAEVHFGVSAIALALFVFVDILVLRSIKPVELWTYFTRTYK